MKYLFFATKILFIFFVVCISGSIRAENNSFENATKNLSISEVNLLHEYLLAFPKLKIFYTNIQMETDLITSKYYKNSDNKVVADGLSEVLHYIYYASSDGDRLKSFYRLDKINYGNDMSMKIPIGTDIVISDPETFHSFAKDARETYFLTNHSNTSEDTISELFSNPFLTSPYAIYGVDLPTWLFEVEGATVLSVKMDKIADSPNEIVTVKFKVSYKKGDAHYKCQLLRNRGWVILSVEKIVGATIREKLMKVGFITKNEYEEEQDGTPILKNISIEEFAEDEGFPETRYTTRSRNYVVAKVISERPAISVFDAKQFLSYSIGKFTYYNYFRIFCFFAGLILITIALYLKCHRQT